MGGIQFKDKLWRDDTETLMQLKKWAMKSLRQAKFALFRYDKLGIELQLSKVEVTTHLDKKSRNYVDGYFIKKVDFEFLLPILQDTFNKISEMNNVKESCESYAVLLNDLKKFVASVRKAHRELFRFVMKSSSKLKLKEVFVPVNEAYAESKQSIASEGDNPDALEAVLDAQNDEPLPWHSTVRVR